MLSILLLILQFSKTVDSCSPSGITSSNGKADELTLNISHVNAIPVDFVVYRKTDFPAVLAPKSAGDVHTNIKKSLQTAMSEVFKANYDPSYRAGEAYFDVATVKYKPLVCDELAIQDVTLVVDPIKNSPGVVCLVSQPGFRNIIAVCKYDGTKKADDTNACLTKATSAKYLNIDEEYLKFGETVKVSYNDDPSGARVSQLRSGFSKYKNGLQNSMRSYLNMFCSGAFQNADVAMNF